MRLPIWYHLGLFTMWEPCDIIIWVVLQMWYTQVGSPLLMLIVDTPCIRLYTTRATLDYTLHLNFSIRDHTPFNSNMSIIRLLVEFLAPSHFMVMTLGCCLKSPWAAMALLFFSLETSNDVKKLKAEGPHLWKCYRSPLQLYRCLMSMTWQPHAKACYYYYQILLFQSWKLGLL